MRETVVTNRGNDNSASAEGWLLGSESPFGSNTLIGARLGDDSVRVRGSLTRTDVLPMSLKGRILDQSIGYFEDGVGETGTGVDRVWASQAGAEPDAEIFWYPATRKYLDFVAAGTGDYASIADNAALDFTVLDIRALIQPNRWRTAAGTMNQRIVSKRSGAGSSYEFSLIDSGANSGRLRFDINGGAQSATSTVQVPFQNFQSGWVRVTHTSGSTNFYWAPHLNDSNTEPTTWIQLGTTQTGVVTAITNSSVPVAFGALPGTGNGFTGKIHVVNMYNTIGAAFNSAQHIVNLDVNRDAATGDGTTTAFTTPRPTLGTTWTVNITRTVSTNVAIAGPSPTGSATVPGAHEFRVANTSLVDAHEYQPHADSYLSAAVSFIAWARVDTTTMPTVEDTAWVKLFGCKEGQGANGPGWAVFMKSDRTVKFEVYNEGQGSLLSPGAITCPTGDYIIALRGNLCSPGYQLQIWDPTDLSTVEIASASSSYGVIADLDPWSYLPQFAFADPASFIPIENVGYARFPVTRTESTEYDIVSSFLTSVIGDETYVDGDTFISTATGTFEGLSVVPGDAVVASSTSDTPTWTKTEMDTTPAWTAITSDWDSGMGIALLEDLTIPATEDFTLWSVFTVRRNPSAEIGWIPVCYMEGELGYLEIGLYEDTGDMYLSVSAYDGDGDEMIAMDEVLTLPVPSSSGISDPIFVALTLDRTNDEVTVWVNDEDFVSPTLTSGALVFDLTAGGYSGWVVSEFNDPPIFQLYGMGTKSEFVNATAMPSFKANILYYLRERADPSPPPDDPDPGPDPTPPPPGNEEIIDYLDYTKASNTAGDYFQNNLDGHGMDVTIYRLTASTKAGQVPTVDMQPNLFTVQRTGKTSAPWQPTISLTDYTVDGTDVPHDTNGLAVGYVDNATIQRVKVMGMRGSMSHPPGETGSLNIWRVNRALVEDVILDGKNRSGTKVAATLFMTNDSFNVTVRDCQFINCVYGFGIANWETAGTNLFERIEFTGCRKAINHEQCLGSFTYVDCDFRGLTHSGGTGRPQVVCNGNTGSVDLTIIEPVWDRTVSGNPNPFRVGVDVVVGSNGTGMYLGKPNLQKLSDVTVVIDGVSYSGHQNTNLIKIGPYW